MSRLAPSRYLETHRWLAELWLNQQTIFGALTHQDQVYSHDYFVPTKELSDDELLARRTQVTDTRPSLPQCAGRALRRLEQAVEAPAHVPVTAGSSGRSHGKRVVVRAIAKPEIDADEISKALRRVVWEMGQQDSKTAHDHDEAA